MVEGQRPRINPDSMVTKLATHKIRSSDETSRLIVAGGVTSEDNSFILLGSLSQLNLLIRVVHNHDPHTRPSVEGIFGQQHTFADAQYTNGSVDPEKLRKSFANATFIIEGPFAEPTELNKAPFVRDLRITGLWAPVVDALGHDWQLSDLQR